MEGMGLKIFDERFKDPEVKRGPGAEEYDLLLHASEHWIRSDYGRDEGLGVFEGSLFFGNLFYVPSQDADYCFNLLVECI